MIETAFSSFLSKNVALAKPDISQGSKSHNYIRSLLTNKHQTDGQFPSFVDGDFLSGSYARGTKIHPLDDIDVMMVIDGRGFHAIRHGRILDAEVRGGENQSVLLSRTGINGLLSSRLVVDIIHKALTISHPTSTVRKDNQAINIKLASGIGVDIVPSFHIVPCDGSQDFYFIPEGGNSDGWITTNPKIDEATSLKFEKAYGDKFKDVVRIIKYWNRFFNGDRLRSYHLEVVVWKTFAPFGAVINSYPAALRYFFNNALPHLSSQCSDPTSLGDPIDNYLSPQDRQLSIDALQRTKAVLTVPFLAAQNVQSETSQWKKVLGSDFNN